MSLQVSGPMFESSNEMFEAQDCLRCRNKKEGAHYNLYHINGGIPALKCLFPEGEADDMNFALFSTSGVHGSYATIEEIEQSLKKYGDKEPDNFPDDYSVDELTVVIIQPRLCCLRYGNVKVTLEDIPYLKKLRNSSWKAVQKIGK